MDHCIEIYSIWEVQSLVFDNCAVVSIVSPGGEHPKIRGENVRVLNIEFYDIIEVLSTSKKCYYPMTMKQAADIVTFIGNSTDLLRWVIHCEAGVSRSPAVALAIASLFETVPGVKKLEEAYPLYNKYVRGVIEIIGHKMRRGEDVSYLCK